MPGCARAGGGACCIRAASVVGSSAIGDLRRSPVPPPPHIIRKPRYAVLFQMNSLSSANHVWASGPGQITTALTLTGENRAGDQDGTPQSMARPRASSLLSTIRDTRPILVSKRVSAMRRISRVVGWWVRGWVGGGERETERRRERVSE